MNRDSINKLTPRAGGSILSANGSCITEKRVTIPLNILIANDIKMSANILKNEKIFDIVYVFGKNLIVNNRKKDKSVGEVSNSEDERSIKDGMLSDLFLDTLSIEGDRLFQFTLRLLEKLQTINNTMIINYRKYYEGE